MKKILFLLVSAFAMIFASCANDSSSTPTSNRSNVEATNVSNEVSNMMSKTNESVKNAADNVMPSKEKVGESVDKVADSVKGVMNKGKESMAERMKKTSDAVTEKTSKTVEEMGDKMKSKISNTSKKLGDKMDSAKMKMGDKMNHTADKMADKMDKIAGSTAQPSTATKAVTAAAVATTATAAAAKTTTANKVSNTSKEVKKTATTDIAKKVVGKMNHDAFDALLKKHVSSNGVVNYKGFKADNHKLEDYIGQLKSNPVSSDMSRKEKLAYWINAYNAFTVKLIVDNYPVSSIKDLHGGKPWDEKWIKIGDKTYSLNNIENDIIRPQFNEPRIHFAVNCAAKSCPPLSNGAWTAANMESKFEKASKAFINNSKYNQVSKTSATVSNIFNWYGSDFGDLNAFLNKYANEPMNSGVKINFMDYDWSLNE